MKNEEYQYLEKNFFEKFLKEKNIEFFIKSSLTHMFDLFIIEMIVFDISKGGVFGYEDDISA